MSNESFFIIFWIVSCIFSTYQLLWAIISGKFLAISGKQYGRPINGQYEVVAISMSKNAALWKTAEGIFVIGSSPP